MVAFYGWGSIVSRQQSHYKKKVYFLTLLPLSPQKVLVLIWSTLEWWKTEWALEPPSDFEPGTPALGMQLPNH